MLAAGAYLQFATGQMTLSGSRCTLKWASDRWCVPDGRIWMRTPCQGARGAGRCRPTEFVGGCAKNPLARPLTGRAPDPGSGRRLIGNSLTCVRKHVYSYSMNRVDLHTATTFLKLGRLTSARRCGAPEGLPTGTLRR